MIKEHWENVYQKSPVDKLGWYEARSEPSLRLIERCAPGKNAAILHVGAGATTLIDDLLDKGYQDIIANDISSLALKALQLRLGPEKSSRVRWIIDDLTDPAHLQSLQPVDLWHDRAVLHFLTQAGEQDNYFRLLKKLVKIGGHVIIAAFNLGGAEKCSGLPVFRYNADMLQEKLGKEFSLVETFDYTYTQPSGNTRAYVYTLFHRNNQ